MRTDEDSFVLVACDGVWDVLTSAEGNQYTTEFIAERKEDTALSKALEDLFDAIIAEDIDDQNNNVGGSDNMSAILVEFKSSTPTSK